MENAKYVAIYVRTAAMDSLSLDNQLEQCLKTTKNLFGYNVEVKFYIDFGKGAFGARNRPALNKMMANINEGIIKAVVTLQVSRLSRDLLEAIRLVGEIDKQNVRFVSIIDGEFGGTSTRLNYILLESIGRFERDELKEAQKKGRQLRLQLQKQTHLKM